MASQTAASRRARASSQSPVISELGDPPSARRVQRTGDAASRSTIFSGRKVHSRSAPLKRGNLRGLEDDLGAAAHLQHVAGREINKHEAGARIDQQVAERVEVQVAGEIGNGKHAIVADAHEPRLAAAMRDVDLPAIGGVVDIGSDEKRIRRRDHAAGAIIQRDRTPAQRPVGGLK